MEKLLDHLFTQREGNRSELRHGGKLQISDMNVLLMNTDHKSVTVQTVGPSAAANASEREPSHSGLCNYIKRFRNLI